MKAEIRANSSSFSFQNPSHLNTTQSSSISGALKECLGNLDGACIEKLLLHFASALECNDVTLAQQVMWVLNNVASSIGDPNQRLASWILRALLSRPSRVCPTSISLEEQVALRRRPMTVTELAGYVDLIPWHRFGFCASNSAILKAIHRFPRVHILDFSITHCMQWPTLIDEVAKRPEGPPSLRLSVPSWRPPVPPLLNVSTEEVCQRLTNFAKFKDVSFEINLIEVPCMSELGSYDHYDLLLSQINPSTLKLRDDEALVINCQNWLRYIPDEQIRTNTTTTPTNTHDISYRDAFLEIIKDLSPCIVTVVDEDCDLGVSSLASRITTCFNYLWIPFDAFETFLPKNSPQRIEYEADIGYKIENIIGLESVQRIERLESGENLSKRMVNKGFQTSPFCEETVKEVKILLDEHASGWGMKKDDEILVLTWKGHNSVYATAWVPNDFGVIETDRVHSGVYTMARPN